MSNFFQGDLLVIKQSAILFGTGGSASIRIMQEPKVALCLGHQGQDRNTLRILMGEDKWLVKPKDCAHYNKRFYENHFKMEEV
tara:strand:- start:3530 stop:3778 length:249 start_codon:yes stop_codon:yes gene_type:complete